MSQTLDLTFSDQTSMQLRVFGDTTSKSLPVLMLFPAMGVEAGYYQPFAEAVAEGGYIVVTADIRGNGLSSVRPSRNENFGYREIVEVDYLGIFEAVYERFPSQKKFVMGHSLGGQMACLFLSRYNFKVDGLILIASCSVSYKGWQGLGRLQVFTVVHAFDALVRLLGYFPGDRIGFGGRGAKNTLLDWCRQGRSGKYRPRGSGFDYEAAMEKLQLQLLAITIEDDWYAPYAAMQLLYKKLNPNSPVEHITYTKEEANNPKLSHFNWGRKPGPLVKKIISWMKARQDFSL